MEATRLMNCTKKVMLVCGGLVVFVLCGSACAAAATVAADAVTADPGDSNVMVSVVLHPNPGDKVCSVQFDVVFDSNALSSSSITIGAAASRAAKDIISYTLTAGRIRVLIAGMNQNTISEGALANLFLDVLYTAALGSYIVGLQGVLLSDPYGSEIASAVISGSISIGGEGEGLPEGEGAAEGAVEGEGGGETGIHSADSNGDGQIQLSELLRVVQFFNMLGYQCAATPATTEDGYVPAPGTNHSCTPHNSDYNPRDWQINLTEILRLVQFFNIGGYHPCPAQGTEDGYCTGPA
jgi:hypothetical protein